MNRNENDDRIKTETISFLSFLFTAALLTTVLLSGCIIDKIGGASKFKPDQLKTKASKGALALIEQAYSGIDPSQLQDYHTHIVGLGTDGSGAHVNPHMQSWRHPIEHLKFRVYASAAGIRHFEKADQEYIQRLVSLIRNMEHHGKFLIFAFDKYYSPDGVADPAKTSFYVPNEYVWNLAGQYPDIFIPVVSVHPYRPDALAELERWGRQGVRFVKWLPNAMGIDPADPAVDPFYQKMLVYNMVLITHTGEEQAVEAEADQRFGNPLLLRRPLDAGVCVIMAHCASLGDCVDLDDPNNGRASCFSLFIRMMEDKRYEGLLFGDISAQVQFNRMPVPISTILMRQDLHHRLVNGSDYPLPGINVILRTGDLVKDGFITEEERKYLNEIYDYNPLLFDFVLKRTVRHPVTKQRLSPEVFLGKQLNGKRPPNK